MFKLIQEEKGEFTCDTCRKKLNFADEQIGVPITVKFGYGHYLDGINVDFCSDKCLIKYIEKNKVNKNDR